ncbi:MAG: glycoside hydrolase family 78 protein [Prevotellaceae bacterium]|jgi:alpha-L-rhamnosidase|nr:glycoside hydrolase family 78 protein [Prevotellaceae bacterium]
MKKDNRNMKKIIVSIMRMKKEILIVVCACFNIITYAESGIYDLRCEYLSDPLSIDTPHPRLAWKIQTKKQGLKQTAYQIFVASDRNLLQEGKADLWDSGKTLSDDQIAVQYAGKDLTGQKLVYWKVRFWDNNDRLSAWSPIARFGGGLTKAEINAAACIGFPKEAYPDRKLGVISPLFRKTFDYRGGATLLYVNSLGYHEVYLNGKKVGDKVLEPSVSQYDKRSLYNTYDLSPYLKKGKNELVIHSGSGWYKSGLPGVAYDSPLLRARMENRSGNEWKTILCSDHTWETALSGYYDMGNWRYQNFVGERVYGGYQPEWRPVTIVEIPPHLVTPQMSEGNYIAETLKVKQITRLSDNSFLVDFGKNIIGWAEIYFPKLTKGQEIVLEYAEHLDSEGNITKMNQRDCYIASGDKNEMFRNRFTYRGFRYIKISGLGQAPPPKSLKSLAIHADFGKESSFKCSDADMNAIHDFVQHTLRCLSAGGHILSDASFERLGYGGDGLASTATAQTMFNLAPLYANWMAAWADCNYPDEGLPHTAPAPYNAGGGPYWCGFVIMAPWYTYLNYGSPKLLKQYYPLMQQWLDYVEKYKKDGLLQAWGNAKYRSRGWFLGDWASPAGVKDSDPKSVEVVNNSFICICYETMSKIAALLGKTEDTKRYSELADTLRKLIHERCFDMEKNIYGSGSQIDLAFPMLASVPGELLSKVKQNLYHETERNDGHISCGLVGIPVLAEWAVCNNAPDFMYSMLKKKDMPGYLYMIEKGEATTTWEHWNAERSHIHNCYNGIGTWFYQAVGGIRPDPSAPGYRKVTISPQIPEGITRAEVTKETPYGTLVVKWKKNNEKIRFDITVPVGCTAELVWKKEKTALECGQHRIIK